VISFGRLSIPRKIVAITMVITAAALLLASAALIGYDYIAARRDLRASTTTLARIIADELNAPVSFNDHAAAIDMLNALRRTVRRWRVRLQRDKFVRGTIA